MSWRPSVLCPVDFSDSSRVALRYAIAIASHFGATVTLVTVNDPILAESADLKLGSDWLTKQCLTELQSEVAKTFAGRALENVEIRYEIATGTPAPEILRVARERQSDLIVMSSRGLSGVRKLFFGATTERVLRETSVPVLVTPPSGAAPFTLEEMAAEIRRVLVPVDLVDVANAVRCGWRRASPRPWARPCSFFMSSNPSGCPCRCRCRCRTSTSSGARRRISALAEAAAKIGSGVKVEALTAFGDSAEEIAKIAADRQVGLLVMGLHASPLTGARMGSVTYRVLCLAHTLVLALPPVPAEAFASLIRRVEHHRCPTSPPRSPPTTSSRSPRASGWTRCRTRSAPGASLATLYDKAPGAPRVRYIQPPVIVDGEALGEPVIGDFRVRVKFYDYGVVSLALVAPMSCAWRELVVLASQDLVENEALQAQAEAALQRILPASARSSR